MVRQYPHTVSYSISAPAVQDNNGNWVPGHVDTFELPGRLETNGAGRVIQSSDGKDIIYSAVVYMPFGEGRVPANTPVTVRDEDGNVIGSGNNLLFSKGQLNRRLWL